MCLRNRLVTPTLGSGLYRTQDIGCVPTTHIWGIPVQFVSSLVPAHIQPLRLVDATTNLFDTLPYHGREVPNHPCLALFATREWSTVLDLVIPSCVHALDIPISPCQVFASRTCWRFDPIRLCMLHLSSVRPLLCTSCHSRVP